ncbi:tRNA 2-thiouridine(34) synthase MnmA [Pelagibacterales bacterium SAG-MED31]|nr:tRNA 2-thiouridine(34) synthase MnmA [Pelagibacterales bacterium SAG-MED31]
MNSLGFNKAEKDTKVIVAMSGGVDSSVAAVKLKKEGYNVIGVTLRLYNQTNISKSKTCCAGVDIYDAQKVAKQYDFPHYIFDFQDKFYNGVISNFINSYANGETPVPCIQCNQTVKFSDLLVESKKLNADALVTGHYAIRKGGLSGSKLFKAKDTKKDQSYFLFATLQEQLDYVRFPLGNFLKSEIRNMAEDYKLTVSDKPDSQDICFVTSDSYRDLINKIQPEINKDGNIFDLNGNKIGIHRGISNYTIGQRKGIGVGGQEQPLYVCEVNKKQNYIVLAPIEKLQKNKIFFKNINWLEKNIKYEELKCSAKIRSTQNEIPGKLVINSNSGYFIFEEMVSATSPGQACVFYKNDQVLGGGWIT